MKSKSQAHCCSDDGEHPSHRKQVSRLNRASGQLEGVRKMIEEQRYCPEILTQLRATRSALKSLEAEILKTHLSSCVAEAFESKRKGDREKKIEELAEIFYRFD